MNFSIKLSWTATSKQLRRFSDFDIGQSSLWNQPVWGPGSTLPFCGSLSSLSRVAGLGGGGCSAFTQLASELCLKFLAQTGLMTSLRSPLAKIWWKVRESLLFFFSSERLLKRNTAIHCILHLYTALVWVFKLPGATYCAYTNILLILNEGEVCVSVYMLMSRVLQQTNLDALFLFFLSLSYFQLCTKKCSLFCLKVPCGW